MEENYASEKNISIPSQYSDRFYWINIARCLWNNRVPLTLITLTCAGLFLGVSLILPKQYQSEARILPNNQGSSRGLLTSGLIEQLGPAAAMLGGFDSLQGDSLLEILKSRTIIERVILDCQLETEIKGWKYRGDLIKRVSKMIRISEPSAKNKTISIIVEAGDPKLAARVASSYISNLKVMLDGLAQDDSTHRKTRLEKQLAALKDDLYVSEERLAKFQATNNISNLPETVMASIRTMTELEAQRISSDVQVKSASSSLDELRRKVSSLQADPQELVQLELRNREYEARRDAIAQAQSAFLKKLAQLPPKSVEFARLQRDVQVKNAIYLVLSQQYETALVTEDTDTKSFILLDAASLPERPSKPKPLVFTFLGCGIGFLGSIYWVLRKQESLVSAQASQKESLLRSEVR